MGTSSSKIEKKHRRILKLRQHIRGTTERPRVCLTQTNKNLYVQAINDSEGKTLTYISTLEKDLNLKSKSKKNKLSAEILAEMFSERLKSKNIDKIVLDRRGKKYYGVIKTFADKLREKGINF